VFSYLFMKLLEGRPQSYDRLITIASRGKIRSAKKTVAAELASARHILEIGCGTGELACMLARQGKMVHGFDINPNMIACARARSRTQNLEEKLSFQKMGVHAMDGLPAGVYDAVVATLVFSELSDDERQFALRHARRILKPEGIIAIADEVIPCHTMQKMAHLMFRIPMLLTTYLIARSTTRPLQNPKDQLNAAGFVVEKEIRSHGGSFSIVTGRLKSKDET
jgi:ubiquinone/menaquinone biosynthesis C-methylase UbiE